MSTPSRRTEACWRYLETCTARTSPCSTRRAGLGLSVQAHVATQGRGLQPAAVGPAPAAAPGGRRVVRAESGRGLPAPYPLLALPLGPSRGADQDARRTWNWRVSRPCARRLSRGPVSSALDRDALSQGAGAVQLRSRLLFFPAPAPVSCHRPAAGRRTEGLCRRCEMAPPRSTLNGRWPCWAFGASDGVGEAVWAQSGRAGAHPGLLHRACAIPQGGPLNRRAARLEGSSSVLRVPRDAQLPGQRQSCGASAAALRALNLAERVGPSPELARGYGSMSVAAGIVQLHSLAGRYAQWAREIAREADDLPALVWVLDSTCAFDIIVGNWTAAREAFTEGLKIAQQLGDQRRGTSWRPCRRRCCTTRASSIAWPNGRPRCRAMASHTDDPRARLTLFLWKRCT